MTTRQAEARVNHEHIKLMYQSAQELGCQLQQHPSRPRACEGLCPFHEADNMNNSRTLELNTESGRFFCRYCHVSGNPLAFMARLWQVSAQDAYVLINAGGSLGPERPPYPADHFPQDGHPSQLRQHTAALTRAHAFYARQLQHCYEAFKFLNALDIEPGPAAAAGLGFASGSGLRKALNEDGLTPEDLAISRLFDRITEGEIFAGRMTLSDLDYAAGAQWMTSFVPHAKGPRGWSERRPGTYGLPGARPTILLGSRSIPMNSSPAIITDDIRFYLVLKANGLPACLITNRRANNGAGAPDPTRQVTQAAGHLMPRRPKSVIIAIAQRQFREALHQVLAESLGAEQVFSYSRSQILQNLESQTRNLDPYRNPEAYPELNVANRGKAPAPADAPEPAMSDPPEAATPSEEPPDTATAETAAAVQAESQSEANSPPPDVADEAPRLLSANPPAPDPADPEPSEQPDPVADTAADPVDEPTDLPDNPAPEPAAAPAAAGPGANGASRPTRSTTRKAAPKETAAATAAAV